MNIIQTTGILSLIIQVFTGIFDYYVLSLEIPPNLKLLSDLLFVELCVQIVEGIFYTWMVINFTQISNITPTRYFDWFITTPTMLLTYSVYLIYLKNSSNDSSKDEIEKDPTKCTGVSCKGMYDIVSENWKVLLPIILLNAIMLIFGYLGEMNIISIVKANILGFIPFFIYFSMIYNNFAKDFALGRYTFAVFFSLWLLYGIAAFLPYTTKNICFNILDLFAKNFFGLFLGMMILYKLNKQKTQQKTHPNIESAKKQ
jgi:hypothetical protein